MVPTRPVNPDSEATAFTAGIDRADAGGDAVDDEDEAFDPDHGKRRNG